MQFMVFDHLMSFVLVGILFVYVGVLRRSKQYFSHITAVSYPNHTVPGQV